MSRDLNKSVLIGNFVADPSVQYTNAGLSIAKFAIANNNTFLSDGKRIDEVSYIDCVCFGKAADNLVKYCKKGHRIGIQGRIKQERWNDKDGKPRSRLVVRVEDYQFLSSGHGQNVGADDENGNIGAEG